MPQNISAIPLVSTAIALSTVTSSLQFFLSEWYNSYFDPMASSLHDHSNCDQVCFGSLYSRTPMRRGSKSQMYLHKILHIITTVPPLVAARSPLSSVSETRESSADQKEVSDGNKGYGELDLTVGVSISSEMEESLSGLSSCSTTVGGGVGPAVIDGGASKVNRENKDEEAEKSLTLLIEAAKLVFGEFQEDYKPEPEIKKEEVAAVEPGERRLRRRSGSLGEEAAAASTVVRTKRGRTQVLPHKYRDSVLEPLIRFPGNGPYMNPTNRRTR